MAAGSVGFALLKAAVTFPLCLSPLLSLPIVQMCFVPAGNLSSVCCNTQLHPTPL